MISAIAEPRSKRALCFWGIAVFLCALITAGALWGPNPFLWYLRPSDAPTREFYAYAYTVVLSDRWKTLHPRLSRLQGTVAVDMSESVLSQTDKAYVLAVLEERFSVPVRDVDFDEEPAAQDAGGRAREVRVQLEFPFGQPQKERCGKRFIRVNITLEGVHRYFCRYNFIHSAGRDWVCLLRDDALQPSMVSGE